MIQIGYMFTFCSMTLKNVLKNTLKIQHSLREIFVKIYRDIICMLELTVNVLVRPNIDMLLSLCLQMKTSSLVFHFF